MDNKTKPSISGGVKVLVVLTFFLPYLGGAVVIVTHNLLWLAVAGVILCAISATIAYFVRKSFDSDRAKSTLIADCMLFPCYYVFAAVMVYYVFLHHR